METLCGHFEKISFFLLYNRLRSTYMRPKTLFAPCALHGFARCVPFWEILAVPKGGLLPARPPSTISAMDSSLSFSARRNEDIALDLLKFVAAHANIGRQGASSTGFGVPSSARPEDQVDQLLDLYTRCREAVEAPFPATGK